MNGPTEPSRAPEEFEVNVALEPCPFCGGVPVGKWDADADTVYCRECEAKGPYIPAFGDGGRVPDERRAVLAIAAWNRRSATPEPFDAFVPTTGHEGTIAQEILAQVAGMRKRGELNQSLCWSPEELELLAMFAINAKHDLERRSATPASPAESGWVIVIDLPAVGLGYWDGHAFSPDNLKAVRFARKYDAEVVRGNIKEWQARTEEHGWG